jgi:arylsulfatase
LGVRAASDTFDVVMAAYPDTGTAERDFDALVGLVKDKTVTSEGLILVEHDLDGKVRVTQTGDHLGRKGLGWGGGVALAVGLFSPPLLASIVVGAAAGALVGTFARRGGPVRPDHHAGQLHARRAGGPGRPAVLLPR